MNEPSRILIDTDVLIDYLRAQPRAVDYLEHLADISIYISVVTVAELYAGTRNEEEQRRIGLMLSDFTILPADYNIGYTAGLMKQQYGKSHGISIADALIAATAQAHGLSLVTLNTKHFPMIENVSAPYLKA